MQLGCSHSISKTNIDKIEPHIKLGSLTLYGEWHGAEESPSYIYELIRALSTHSAKPVAVGLEWPITDTRIIQRFLAEPDKELGYKILLQNKTLITSPIQDGRTSIAMIELIQKIKDLRLAGKDIDVFLFDIDHNKYTDNSIDREAEMAKNIYNYAKSHQRARIQILTGNIHARKNAGVPWDNNFKTMGSILKEKYNLDVYSYAFNYPAGHFWICDDKNVCGINQNGMKDYHSNSVVIENIPSKGSHNFNGIIYLKSSTASRPFKLSSGMEQE